MERDPSHYPSKFLPVVLEERLIYLIYPNHGKQHSENDRCSLDRFIRVQRPIVASVIIVRHLPVSFELYKRSTKSFSNKTGVREESEHSSSLTWRTSKYIPPPPLPFPGSQTHRYRVIGLLSQCFGMQNASVVVFPARPALVPVPFLDLSSNQRRQMQAG